MARYPRYPSREIEFEELTFRYARLQETVSNNRRDSLEVSRALRRSEEERLRVTRELLLANEYIEDLENQ